ADIVVAISGDRFVTPKSAALVRSVTRRWVVGLVEDQRGAQVETRAIDLRREIAEFEEVAACGTAAVLSPVGRIWVDGNWHSFYGNGEQVGPVMQKAYDLLVGIQRGESADKYGWTHEVSIP